MRALARLLRDARPSIRVTPRAAAHPAALQQRDTQPLTTHFRPTHNTICPICGELSPIALVGD